MFVIIENTDKLCSNKTFILRNKTKTKKTN